MSEPETFFKPRFKLPGLGPDAEVGTFYPTQRRTFVRYNEDHTLVVTRKTWNPNTEIGLSESRPLTLSERVLWRVARRMPRFER
jgi:hypothetical protein